ncbi:MAG: protein kinase [Pirellulaceae bacterium]|nr:protein kinase [Pirellulaceae bacterium]
MPDERQYAHVTNASSAGPQSSSAEKPYPRLRPDCPAASKFFMVEAELTGWTDNERNHIAGCPHCRTYLGQVRQQLDGRPPYDTIPVGSVAEATIPADDSLDISLVLAAAVLDTPRPAGAAPRHSRPRRSRQQRNSARRAPDAYQTAVKLFDNLELQEYLEWQGCYPLLDKVGCGGQGVVYRTLRRGAPGFERPFALKAFSPHVYADFAAYEAAMERMAHVLTVVASTQDGNLVNILSFDEWKGVSILSMDLVDGYDLRRLLSLKMLEQLQKHAAAGFLDRIHKAVIKAGKTQAMVMPAVAVAIIRACLAGLSALHRRNIVHADLKPSNIMMQRIGGGVKIIDLGSAIDCNQTLLPAQYTPEYAAPEVCERRECTPQSDLASLGYVLIEMLAGQRLFTNQPGEPEYVQAKRDLPHRLTQLLPDEYVQNKLLMAFCRRMIHPDLGERFQSAAEAEEHAECGAFQYWRQLAKAGMDSPSFFGSFGRWLEWVR